MKRLLEALAVPIFASCAAFGQSAASQPLFEVAQVRVAKPSPGRAWERLTAEPNKLTGSGVMMKQLIFEAYDMPYSRIFGGPSWLDSEFYDLEAKSAAPVGRDQLKLMLRSLLADRFKLAVHRETREMRAYVLTVAKGGSKLHAAKDGEVSADQKQSGGLERFHGDMTEFANLLAIRLNMPMVEDPTVPVRSTGAPPPVLDKTGLKGVFDIAVAIRPEPGADTFVLWQRALEDQLGLKLESQKGPIEVLVIDHVERIPTEN